MYVCMYVSIYLSIHLSIYLSIYLYVYNFSQKRIEVRIYKSFNFFSGVPQQGSVLCPLYFQTYIDNLML